MGIENSRREFSTSNLNGPGAARCGRVALRPSPTESECGRLQARASIVTRQRVRARRGSFMSSATNRASDRSTPLRRRTALRLFVGGAGIAILAACGPTTSGTPAATPTAPPKPAPAAPTTPPAAAPSKPAATQRRTGGTLRVGVPADISSLDGHTSSSILSITQSMAFDRLVAYDVKATPRPSLAESWDVSPDYKQVKLNLRKGVQ